MNGRTGEYEDLPSEIARALSARRQRLLSRTWCVGNLESSIVIKLKEAGRERKEEVA